MPTRAGSIRLFKAFGIEVFLHWSWFLVAVYEVQMWRNIFDSPAAAVLLYLLLFVLVTMHEFGHALACRSVGGRAEQIFLWPLGGIAFVSPPPRPGAMLWSLAAGPLVNVALVPILAWAKIAAARAGWVNENVDGFLVLTWIARINLGLLIFNLLPVYPLDGGQILRSLLWFFIGPIRSLFITTGIGFVAAAAGLVLALSQQSYWFAIMAFFVLSRAVLGWREARYLREQAEMTTREATVEKEKTVL